MSLTKNYKGYTSFDYLEKDVDYRHFMLADEVNRVPSSKVVLNEDQEALFQKILEDHILISVHEHLGSFPKDIMQTPAYVKEARMATAFEGHAQGHRD